MSHLISIFTLINLALAGEGADHSHGPDANLGSVAILFAVLIVAGVIFHFATKKKK
jgi:hypothetical protein